MNNAYFDRRARGGAIASRVDSQDPVASVLALTAMRSSLNPLLPATIDQPVKVFCEGREDLEFVQGEMTLLVSVKDKMMTSREVSEEARRKLDLLAATASERDEALRICALGGVDASARSMVEDIEHLRARMPDSRNYAKVVEEFEARWALPARLATRLWVDCRNLSRNSPEAHAIFANELRLTFPTTTLTDWTIRQIEDYLTDAIFAGHRRGRGVVDLLDLESQISSMMAPHEILNWSAGYTATSFGYISDGGVDDRISERSLVVRAYRSVRREWVRKTRIERHLLPRVSCLQCNHPLMANWNSRFGCACPDCGFTPFGTLFYACDCAAPIPLVDNPPMNGPEIFAAAIRATRSGRFRCTKCERSVDSRKLTTRVFFAPYPFPVPKSVDAVLIARRIAMGRPQVSFTQQEAVAWLQDNDGLSTAAHLAQAEREVKKDYVRTFVQWGILLAVGVYLFLTRPEVLDPIWRLLGG